MQDGLDLSAVGAKPLSKLAMCLKPRYHFAALHQTFYERIPYRYSTSIPVCLDLTYYGIFKHFFWKRAMISFFRNLKGFFVLFEN